MEQKGKETPLTEDQLKRQALLGVQLESAAREYSRSKIMFKRFLTKNGEEIREVKSKPVPLPQAVVEMLKKLGQTVPGPSGSESEARGAGPGALATSLTKGQIAANKMFASSITAIDSALALIKGGAKTGSVGAIEGTIGDVARDAAQIPGLGELIPESVRDLGKKTSELEQLVTAIETNITRVVLQDRSINQMEREKIEKIVGNIRQDPEILGQSLMNLKEILKDKITALPQTANANSLESMPTEQINKQIEGLEKLIKNYERENPEATSR